MIPIIPVFFRHHEEKCPSCNKNENIKNVCRHCNHEYEESDENLGIFILGVILFATLIVWLFYTFMEWGTDYSDNASLLNTLKDQWRWVKHLRIW